MVYDCILASIASLIQHAGWCTWWQLNQGFECQILVSCGMSHLLPRWISCFNFFCKASIWKSRLRCSRQKHCSASTRSSDADSGILQFWLAQQSKRRVVQFEIISLHFRNVDRMLRVWSGAAASRLDSPWHLCQSNQSLAATWSHFADVAQGKCRFFPLLDSTILCYYEVKLFSYMVNHMMRRNTLTVFCFVMACGPLSVL